MHFASPPKITMDPASEKRGTPNLLKNTCYHDGMDALRILLHFRQGQTGEFETDVAFHLLKWAVEQNKSNVVKVNCLALPIFI